MWHPTTADQGLYDAVERERKRRVSVEQMDGRMHGWIMQGPRDR